MCIVDFESQSELGSLGNIQNFVTRKFCDDRYVADHAQADQKNKELVNKKTYWAGQNHISQYTSQTAMALRIRDDLKNHTNSLSSSSRFYLNFGVEIEAFIYLASYFPKDMPIFHGVEHDEPIDEIRALMANGKYSPKTLCSFTSDMDVAVSWAKHCGTNYIFTLLGGTPLGTSVETISGKPDEHEVLLSGGNIFEVQDMATHGDVTEIKFITAPECNVDYLHSVLSASRTFGARDVVDINAGKVANRIHTPLIADRDEDDELPPRRKCCC